ncbi:MAG: alanine racemase [Gorillibacterium sp.]|nr:alanine racemase [Gorillibacterium sp.]
MESFYRPTRVEISLDALYHNIRAFRHYLPEPIHLMAVIKADAYGHGAVQVAREAITCGVDYLAVAFLDEALELRRAGVSAPILVLGHTPVNGISLAAENNISLTVYSDEALDAIARRPQGVPPVTIHIKIDTGMGRIGLNCLEDASAFVSRALSLPGVKVEGLYTHYACADECDKTFTLEQHSKLKAVVDHFADKGITFPYIHAGNSAAAIDTPELTYNMVRLGIGMYGLYPSENVGKEQIQLQPVMSIKTGVVMLKPVPLDSGISYGHRYRTKREGEMIATLPVGYADGYSRMLTGKVQALIKGQRVPVVGTICMDQCMIDVSDIAGAALGDEVVILGRQGEEMISAEELAAGLGTLNYEIVCMISHRVPRVYTRNGRAVYTVNHLRHEMDTME